MTRLWFVVPAHGRVALARVCLRQLRRTCDALKHYKIDATAVVISDDANLDTAEELGFATVRRDNDQLGRRFNDGYQLACDPDFNAAPADYVMPCGTDDWIDPMIFRQLPPPDRIGVFRQMAIVNEERTRLSRIHCPFKGGAGLRIIPWSLIAQTGFRPAEEDRPNGIDSSAFAGFKRATGRIPLTVELDVHPLQIVDWKSHREQLHSYAEWRWLGRGDEAADPFKELAGVYPDEALEEMREFAGVPA